MSDQKPTSSNGLLRQARKFLIALGGGTVLLIGLLMVVLPGPAIVVIPLGLTILATEFVWAKHWLDKMRKLVRSDKKNVP